MGGQPRYLTCQEEIGSRGTLVSSSTNIYQAMAVEFLGLALGRESAFGSYGFMGVVEPLIVYYSKWFGRKDVKKKRATFFILTVGLGMVLGMGRDISFHSIFNVNVGRLLPVPRIFASSLLAHIWQ